MWEQRWERAPLITKSQRDYNDLSINRSGITANIVLSITVFNVLIIITATIQVITVFIITIITIIITKILIIL